MRCTCTGSYIDIALSSGIFCGEYVGLPRSTSQEEQEALSRMSGTEW